VQLLFFVRSLNRCILFRPLAAFPFHTSHSIKARFPLKSQDKNSGLFQDFSGPEIPKHQHLFFLPFLALTYEFDSKTRHCETKNAMPMQYFFAIATTIAIALLNINDDKQECNSSITNYSSATDVLA